MKKYIAYPASAVTVLLALSLVGCGASNAQHGAVAGSVVGGAIGHQFGKGNGKRAAEVAGVIAGGVIGGNMGAQQDYYYQNRRRPYYPNRRY